MFLQPDLHILLLPFCNFTVFYCHVWEWVIGFCWLRSTRVIGVEEKKAEENEKNLMDREELVYIQFLYIGLICLKFLCSICHCWQFARRQTSRRHWQHPTKPLGCVPWIPCRVAIVLHDTKKIQNTNKNLYSAKFFDKKRQRRWVVS